MTLFSRSRLVLALSAAIGLLVAPAVTRAADVTIDTATTYQTIEGFGTCLAWWVNNPSDSVYYDARFRDLYARDLGFNILRVEMHPSALMGPGQTLDSPVELDDDIDGNVAKFNFDRREVKVYGDLAEYVRDNVLEPGTFKLVGAYWTPPHWLKGPTGTKYWTGDAAPWAQGDGNTAGGRLKQDDYSRTQFARYAAAWIRGFERKYRVNWTAVSLQNELIFETAYNSATYWKNESGTVDQFWQYADMLRSVADYFNAKGMAAKIMGPHHSHIAGSPGNPWHYGIQMSFIDAVKNHKSGNLMNELDIIASNDYVDEGMQNHAAMLHGYWAGKANTPVTWAWGHDGNISQYGKQNWFQEGSGEGTGWGKDEAPALALKLHDALVQGHASAYIYWQTADGYADPTEHILLGTNQLGNPHASKKYCSMKHFSRYIRPGSKRVKATFDQSGWASYGGAHEDDTYNSINVSAYVKGSDLTVVLVNMRNNAEQTNVRIPSSLGISSLQQWRTSANEGFAAQASLPVSNGQVSLSVPALSVVTLYSKGSGGGTPTTYSLTVAKAGSGAGTVTSSPSGIDCGTSCSSSYDSGTSVTLSASPASGSSFGGWSGACSGSGACTVSMSAARSVTATFNASGGGTTQLLTVTKSGTGSGTVTSSPAGIDCGNDCSENCANGETHVLTATPAAGSTFVGWSGACSGTGTCSLTMTSPKTATATFDTTGGTGGGTTYGNNGKPWSVASGTVRIEAENYDEGGADKGYRDTTSANEGGQYRNDGVDIETTVGGGYNVGWVGAGEWLQYTLDVATAGNYEVSLRVARRPAGSSTVKVMFGGVDKTGDLSVASTGDWQSWTDLKKTVALAAGRQAMRVSMVAADFNLNWIEIKALSTTPANPTLSVSKSGTGSGTVKSSPAGIDCGTTCSAGYAAGTSVTLSATAASDSTFTGWSGACTGTGTCTVTMSGAQAVSAGFSSSGASSQQTYGNNNNPWPVGSGTRRVEAENYDQGGEGTAYHDEDGVNSGGQYRADAVDIETTSGGGHNVGWIGAGEWLEYTVNVATAGNYDLSLRVARQPAGDQKLRVLFGDVDKTGEITVPSTGGWQTWTAVSKTIALAAGTQVMRVAAIGNEFNLDWIELKPSSSTPPAVTPTLTFYGDALATDWSDFSWNASVNYGSTSPVKVGSKAISASLQAAWAAVSFRKGAAVSTSGYTAIKLWIHGGSGADKLIRVFTYTGDTTGQSTGAAVVTVKPNVWTEFTVPLSQLGNPASIKRVAIQDHSGGSQTIAVDDVRLVP